jgi:hydroxymethyl cephem carbamoyltransferase
MLIMALKPGQHGAVAVLDAGRLVLSLESEKDSFDRYAAITPTTLLDVAKRLDAVPDVVAIGGWHKHGTLGDRSIGAGYLGLSSSMREARFFGKPVRIFSSTHERSHILMATGMAPDDHAGESAVLVWEGATGSFFIVDGNAVTREIPVLAQPGARYAFLFGLADPTFPDYGGLPRMEDAGKLMALAAFGHHDTADPAVIEVVDRIMALPTLYPAPKREFRDTVLYNAAVEADVVKAAAAVITRRIFDVFYRAAATDLPRGLPLQISGGCGLNCGWNTRWRDSGLFSSVFVPPCTNDSGSAIGTAIDAYSSLTSAARIEWSVYSGLDFVHDIKPDPHRWIARPLNHDEVAGALASGRVVAWVQGRWEIGPRALGNRSLLAEPFAAAIRDRLNYIKQRESYLPIAACCRTEDVDRAFVETFADPHMLYLRRVRMPELAAVTHADGSARAQTVAPQDNPRLHAILSAFAEIRGVGALCNASLSFKGKGFINRMSDLLAFCAQRGVTDMVVDGTWYTSSEVVDREPMALAVPA